MKRFKLKALYSSPSSSDGPNHKEPASASEVPAKSGNETVSSPVPERTQVISASVIRGSGSMVRTERRIEEFASFGSDICLNSVASSADSAIGNMDQNALETLVLKRLESKNPKEDISDIRMLTMGNSVKLFLLLKCPSVLSKMRSLTSIDLVGSVFPVSQPELYSLNKNNRSLQIEQVESDKSTPQFLLLGVRLLKNLKFLRSLKVLSLRDAELSTCRFLAALPKLEVADLSNNRIFDLSDWVLDLNDTVNKSKSELPWEDSSFGGEEDMYALRQLNLSYNMLGNVESLCLIQLKPYLTQTTLLRLQGNPCMRCPNIQQELNMFFDAPNKQQLGPAHSPPNNTLFVQSRPFMELTTSTPQKSEDSAPRQTQLGPETPPPLETFSPPSTCATQAASTDEEDLMASSPVKQQLLKPPTTTTNSVESRSARHHHTPHHHPDDSTFSFSNRTSMEEVISSDEENRLPTFGFTLPFTASNATLPPKLTVAAGSPPPEEVSTDNIKHIDIGRASSSDADSNQMWESTPHSPADEENPSTAKKLSTQHLIANNAVSRKRNLVSVGTNVSPRLRRKSPNSRTKEKKKSPSPKLETTPPSTPGTTTPHPGLELKTPATPTVNMLSKLNTVSVDNEPLVEKKSSPPSNAAARPERSPSNCRKTKTIMVSEDLRTPPTPPARTTTINGRGNNTPSVTKSPPASLRVKNSNDEPRTELGDFRCPSSDYVTVRRSLRPPPTLTEDYPTTSKGSDCTAVSLVGIKLPIRRENELRKAGGSSVTGMTSARVVVDSPQKRYIANNINPSRIQSNNLITSPAGGLGWLTQAENVRVRRSSEHDRPNVYHPAHWNARSQFNDADPRSAFQTCPPPTSKQNNIICGVDAEELRSIMDAWNDLEEGLEEMKEHETHLRKQAVVIQSEMMDTASKFLELSIKTLKLRTALLACLCKLSTSAAPITNGEGKTGTFGLPEIASCFLSLFVEREKLILEHLGNVIFENLGGMTWQKLQMLANVEGASPSITDTAAIFNGTTGQACAIGGSASVVHDIFWNVASSIDKNNSSGGAPTPGASSSLINGNLKPATIDFQCSTSTSASSKSIYPNNHSNVIKVPTLSMLLDQSCSSRLSILYPLDKSPEIFSSFLALIAFSDFRTKGVSNSWFSQTEASLLTCLADYSHPHVAAHVTKLSDQLALLEERLISVSSSQTQVEKSGKLTSTMSVLSKLMEAHSITMQHHLKLYMSFQQSISMFNSIAGSVGLVELQTSAIASKMDSLQNAFPVIASILIASRKTTATGSEVIVVHEPPDSPHAGVSASGNSHPSHLIFDQHMPYQ